MYYILYSLKKSIKSSDPYLKKVMSGIIGIWGEKKDIGCSWVEKVNPREWGVGANLCNR